MGRLSSLGNCDSVSPFWAVQSTETTLLYGMAHAAASAVLDKAIRARRAARAEVQLSFITVLFCGFFSKEGGGLFFAEIRDESRKEE